VQAALGAPELPESFRFGKGRHAANEVVA
jgi:hypothetical protein